MLAIYGCPAKYPAFGIAGLIEAVVYYFIYADVMAPLFTHEGKDWLRKYVSTRTQDTTCAAWIVRGVAAPRLVALIVMMGRLLLAVGVIFFSLPATFSGDNLKGQTLWAVYFCIVAYILIQLAVWFWVIRRDVGRHYAEAFREFEKSGDVTNTESVATNIDGGPEA